MTETRLERLRRIELERVRMFFRPGMRVLEIGGGNGYQANLISSWGCTVTSVDVANRPTWPVIYFDVQNYDGVNLPFPDESFDVVFSSNVLEHVPINNLPVLLKENRRVMCKPQGVSVHVLPTAAWRFWNNFAHYIYLCKYMLGYGKTAMMPSVPSRDDALKQYGLLNLIRRAIIPAPHGEYPNALTELYYFAKKRWVNEFRKSGLKTQELLNLNIFYTGYGLVQNISPENRIELAKYLGTATYAYVLKAA
ncbi:MAG TPA: class I SAM-dependent methyltransferase [Blastocatellia bacterium]|nr:class I SAM-dependent methyltransferase [Blastocatellia bacterium]